VLVAEAEVEATLMLHKVMLTGEWLLCNTLNINVVYMRKLGQSILFIATLSFVL